MKFAGVDIGTSGLKVAVVDDSGRVVDERTAGYATKAPEPGWCEIDPFAWLRAYQSASEGLGAVDAIGFAGQMHGVVLTDEYGVPLRPAVLWPDRRAEAIAARWERTGVLDGLDTPVKPGYAALSLAWLAVNEPDVIARTARVWFAKDWVRTQLGNEPDAVTERSDAAGSLLWDPSTRDWSPQAARLAGIAVDVLPRLCESTDSVGMIDGVPAVVGGADTATALDAYRAVESGTGTVYVNAGSGCQIVRWHESRPRRSTVAECVFADTGVGWYAMRALDARTRPDPVAFAATVADAVAAFQPEQVVVGGGAARDPRFCEALRHRVDRPMTFVGLRSLSACGAALLAATSMGRRIGLRHDVV